MYSATTSVIIIRLLPSLILIFSFSFFFKVYHLVQISPLVRLFSNVSCKQASFSASTYRAETRSSIPFNFFLGFPFRFPLNCLNAADSWEFRAFTDTPRRARRDEITLWAIVKGKKKKKEKEGGGGKKNRIRWRSDEEESVFPQETAREGSGSGG